jgi:hypothetical protein
MMHMDRLDSHMRTRRGAHEQTAFETRRERGALRHEPSDGSRPIGWPRTLVALLAAPLAWLLQLGIAQQLVRQRCLSDALSFVASPGVWASPGMVAAGLACIVLGGVGLAVAWHNLRRTSRINWRFPAAMRGTRAERDWFIARVCALSSTMFVLCLAATDVALTMAPCGL